MAAPTTHPSIQAHVAPLDGAGWRDWLAGLVFATLGLRLFFPLDSYLQFAPDKSFQATGLPIMPVTLVLLVAAMAALKRYHPVDWRHWLICAPIPLMAFASMAWATDPYLTFLRAMRFVPELGLPVILAQCFSARRSLRIMVITCLIGALISIAISLAIPGLGSGAIGESYASAWRGAGVQKNFAGFAFSFAPIVILTALFVRAIRPPLAIMALVPSLIFLAATQSATAYLTTAIGILTFGAAWAVTRVSAQFRPLAIIMIVALVIFVALLGQYISSLALESVGRSSNLTGRQEIWDSINRILPQHSWRGFGYAFWVTEHDPYATSMRRYVGDEFAHAHNSYLDLWVQLGLVGIVTIIGILATYVSKAVARLFRSEQIFLSAMCLSILVMLIVRGMSEVQFSDPFTGGWFWLLWSAALLFWHPLQRWQAQTRPPYPIHRDSRRLSGFSTAV